MALNRQEAELLAALPQDPAYILLTTKLQAVVDDVTNAMAASTPEGAAKIFPVWKALKVVVAELISTPQNVSDWLNENPAGDVSHPEGNRHTAQQLQEYYKQVQLNQQDKIDNAATIDDLYAPTFKPLTNRQPGVF